MSGDPFGLRSLDLDALRAKRVAKWQVPDVRYSAWVADMDFPVAPCIAAALHQTIERGELGYAAWGGPYANTPAAGAFVRRMTERYGWTPSADHLHELNDVVQGVRVVVQLMTQPGDGILLHLPAYHPFLDTIESMGRSLVAVPWTRQGIDTERLEATLATTRARAWILCHPHNPLGHVFCRRELEQIAEIAERHDLIVISDEIHADLTMPGVTHLPFAAVEPQAAARTVTLTSASKAFNLAGLRWAVLHAGHRPTHQALAALPGHYLGAPNVLAVNAAVAAWTDGEPWLAAVRDLIDENALELVGLLDHFLPGTRYDPPRSTYLAWIDCSALGLGDDPAATFRARGVELSPGPQFGPPGTGHVRLNMATSPAILAAMVEAMAG